MAGTCQAVFIAVLLGGFVATASAATAETVPLPTPAPLPKSGGAPMPPAAVPSARPGTPAQGSQQQESGIQSWLPPIFGGKEAKPSVTLEPAQRTLVDKVSSYLSKVSVMSGQFVQIGPDGRQSKGQFYVQKPGKVRFDYDSPSRIDIIADGSSVVVRDRKLNTKDIYSLSQTPLRFLLSDRIDLLKETTVTGVYADDIYVTIVVEEKQVLVGTSRLMMMFGAKDFQLKQWVVTDPQGYDTTIAISNLDTTRRPDPDLFVIDYTEYRN
jgi:outer membrane lipoprotein-sorting protein